MHVEDRQESRHGPNQENTTACFSASKEIQAHYQASPNTVHRICASWGTDQIVVVCQILIANLEGSSFFIILLKALLSTHSQ